jgi:hypothetical protein
VSGLTTEDAARAASWNIPIAGTLIPAEIPFTDENGSRHYHKQGGLYVDLGTGTIRWHAEKIFGDSVAHIIRFIQAIQRRYRGTTYNQEQATAWLTAFLALPEHQGTGPLDTTIAEETKTRRVAHAEWLKELLAEATPLAEDCSGSYSGDGERYLIARGLPGPWPIELLWHPHVRTGEGAILAPLTSVSAGRITGYLLTYVTALGTKSLVRPPRNRLNLEPAADAVMVIADREPGCVDIIADTILTEGLENGLSITRVKRPGWRIIALAGLNTGVHFTPERLGERIIFFQDSDPEGHPARDALQRVIDALKLAGANVSLTAFSPLGDANDILRHNGQEEGEQIAEGGQP